MMDHAERIAWGVAAVAAFLYAVARALQWWRHRVPDDAIDRLIAENRAKPSRTGYETTDAELLNRAGQRWWELALRAQRRQRKPKGQRRQQKPSESNVRRFDRTG